MSGNGTASASGRSRPGLLRPPNIFLAAILSGIALQQWLSLDFVPPGARLLRWLGAVLCLGAVPLFVLALRAFRAAGTPVQGHRPTTVVVQSGPYGRSRNPIFLSFILLVLGLSLWLNNLWLLLTLAPAATFIATVVIPREERFLERQFGKPYLDYKRRVRRWL